MRKPENYDFLPEFPRIPHLLKPTYRNTDDLVALPEDVQRILSQNLIVEEKLDGANCGMTYSEDKIGMIRNRTHILSKNYPNKNTPAKDQFLPAWGWQSKNRDKFELLYKLSKERLAIYGEWCLAIHGVTYNNLPDMFITYALYSPSRHKFIPSNEARDLLTTSGFHVAKLLFKGKTHLRDLLLYAEGVSAYSTHPREGIVIKITDSNQQYKLIRQDYQQNTAWDNKVLHKQPSFDKEHN